MKVLRWIFSKFEHGNPLSFLIFALSTHLYDILSTVVALGFWPDIFREATPIWACMIEKQGLAFTVFVCSMLKMTSPALLYYVPIHNYLKNSVLFVYGFFGMVPCVSNTINLIAGLS